MRPQSERSSFEVPFRRFMLAGFGKAIYVSIVILIARAASMKKITSDTKNGRGRPALLERTAGAAVAETLFHREGYDQLGIAALCAANALRNAVEALTG